VAKTGWISAVLHEAGYLELIVRSREDERLKKLSLESSIDESSHTPKSGDPGSRHFGLSGNGKGKLFFKRSFLEALASAPWSPTRPSAVHDLV
jgi:hypothetical protein